MRCACWTTPSRVVMRPFTGDGAPCVEDLGSANGTHVGGQRLAANLPTPVPPAVIEIGDALLVLREMHGAEREPARASGDVPLDPAMARVHETVQRIAPSTLSVLLLGETGVGKGVVADAIHRHSPRADRPFVRVNCAAIADSLLESELFGHERGAFTGAVQAKPGLLEAANAGTILLDRDRRHAAGHTGEAAAFARAQRGTPGGKRETPAHRRSGRRRDQPRPAGAPSRESASAKTSSFASMASPFPFRPCANDRGRSVRSLALSSRRPALAWGGPRRRSRTAP